MHICTNNNHLIRFLSYKKIVTKHLSNYAIIQRNEKRNLLLINNQKQIENLFKFYFKISYFSFRKFKFLFVGVYM